MNTCLHKFGKLVIGFYAWIVTLFLGAILLDIAYFNLLSAEKSFSQTSQVFSEVSDGLLCISLVTMLTGAGAIVVSWKYRPARSLLIASLVVVVLEFIAPVFFTQLIQNTQSTAIGPWLRSTLSGLVSLLAFTGMFVYCRQS